ncbi:MAG TPA: 1,4-alpha-glucan branching protein GlgB [Actinomycetota bacterium]|nr:1,4-alpha-glucan branching protein GlgB [Actinomycetota bacterium]
MSKSMAPPRRSLLTADDVYLFNEGTHSRLQDHMGAHEVTFGGERGTAFAVWAPNAEGVWVTGDFNGWSKTSHPLEARENSGIWEGFIPGVRRGAVYKYHVASRYAMYRADKADPFALCAEVPPRTASMVWDLDYTWGDAAWMAGRGRLNALDAPQSIYEVHIGSWMRVPEEGSRPLTYRELAPRLCEYVERMGFTHVEFLPVMEHPFFGSWGYQTTGYFAPTSRYGTPQDFMHLIDTLHQHGIGVILDWVPSHFPTDEHGLGFFDGTHLFEHSDPRKGFHPDWNSFIFNYGRNEVRSFLTSSAMHWLSTYHADGLRVDAVASMLYLDYSRKAGEWIPNEHGGRENLEALGFLRKLNETVYRAEPSVQTTAEESTAWPMVSKPTYVGGLGFGFKWDMGWMHDTLSYMSLDPIHRRFHHNLLTFRMLYAYAENYVLPLSHDEITHGKGSLLGKMPGDEQQRFANLRALFGYMWAEAGKKLLFMGGEIAQWNEWYHETSIDWHLLAYGPHAGVQRWVRDLNQAYRSEPALYELDCDPAGFEWVDANDTEASVISLLRKSRSGDTVLVVCNFTPVDRSDYEVGVPVGGWWREILNSNAADYGGTGLGNAGGVASAPVSVHGRPHSLRLTLPGLSCLYFKAPAAG